MDFVLDCSVTMSWCFEDETSPATESILDMLADGFALVPSLWSLEVANVLLAAERRKRLTEAQSVRFVELLRSLPITIDEDTSSRAFRETMLLAREHGLSSYDAAYVELALREGLPLATRDIHLKRAARKCGIRLIP